MTNLPPLIPRSRTNPIGQTLRIRRARKVIDGRLRVIERRLLKLWSNVPFTIQNQFSLVNRFYDYQISREELATIIRRIVRELRDTGQDELARQVEAAYREGTAKAVENLLRLSEDYTRTATEALSSLPVQRRASLAGGRVFELMEGFSGDVGADLGRVLFQAVQDGVNPTVVARDIRKRFGVHRRRAERIARTEITMALRRGRFDEVSDAQERFGIELRILHYSALIPGRTRQTHAQRHGRIVTVEDQRNWYATDANAINCLCSSSEIAVDENGKPISGAPLLRRMKKQRAEFIEAGAASDT